MELDSSLKLVSLNIEGDKHVPEVLAFFKQEKPEVLCLQEVFLRDFEMFKKELRMKGMFTPVAKLPSFHANAPPFSPNGVALLCRLPAGNFEIDYYAGGPSRGLLPETLLDDPKEIAKQWGVLLRGNIQKGDRVFSFATTHFTWTPDGKADETQREHLGKLLQILEAIPKIVFCGDFNAPRGREIFSKLAKRYKDNIPQTYTTSIDADVHKAGALQLMVDGLFTTPQYKAVNVRLVKGGSDHLAIVAKISRTS